MPNIFTGKVVSTKDGKIEIETPDGLKIFAPEPEDLAGNAITGFFVHPELISLTPGTADAPPADSTKQTELHGKIKEVFYQGDFSEYTVSLEEMNMIMTVHLTRSGGYRMQLPEGQDVTVSWDYGSNNVLTG